MDKHIKIWINVLEKAKENITGTLNYNGLIIDDLDNLIQDMKRAQEETKKGVYPCEKCGNKIQSPMICRSCYHLENPDAEI